MSYIVACSPPCSNLYKDNLKQYVENKYVQQATGFKPLAEIINGRAAMLVRGSDRQTWPAKTATSLPCFPSSMQSSTPLVVLTV